MAQAAAVGVVLRPRLQRDGVVAALGVGQLHPVPGPERPAARPQRRPGVVGFGGEVVESGC